MGHPVLFTILADFCEESRDNLELIISKLQLRRALLELGIPYHYIGDLKMCNTLIGLLEAETDFFVEFKTFFLLV